MIKANLKSFMLFILAVLGVNFLSSPALAEEVNAYQFVSRICAQTKGASYWKDGFELEIKNIAITFGEGLMESTIRPEGLIQRVSGNPYTEQIRKTIGSRDFLKAVYHCYPDSKIKRDLLVARIIFSSSFGYASGVGVGVVGGMKLFSWATQALGSTALPALRYLGFTEAALIRLKTLGIITTYVAVGGIVYSSIDDAIKKYEVINAQANSMEKNDAEIIELSQLENEILELLKKEKDPATIAKLEGQLSTVQHLIDQRSTLYLKAKS